MVGSAVIPYAAFVPAPLRADGQAVTSRESRQAAVPAAERVPPMTRTGIEALRVAAARTRLGNATLGTIIDTWA
jgi:hypothetical protein